MNIFLMTAIFVWHKATFPHFLPLPLSWIVLDCFSLVHKLLNNLVFAWYAANILQTPLCEFKLPNANKILTFRVKQCVEETCFTSTYWWTWCIGSINRVLSIEKHSFQINRLFYSLHFSSLHIFSQKYEIYVLLLPQLALSDWFLLGWTGFRFPSRTMKGSLWNLTSATAQGDVAKSVAW